MSVERVYSDSGELIAVVLQNYLPQPGPEFFTPPVSQMQMGVLAYRAGHVIQMHYHDPPMRLVRNTSEALVVLRGRVLVQLGSSRVYVLQHGDAVLLLNTPHSVSFLTDSELLEIKQGPYLEDKRCIT